MTTELFAATESVIAISDPDRKVRAARALWSDWLDGRLAPAAHAPPPAPIGEPGRPERPALVPPRDLPRRRLGSTEGRAALLHAIAHIEFNAINLALDAVYRFRGLPSDYYEDWLRVADDEARHYCMLADRLDDLGHAYGDFPAHDGLWRMARQTAHDWLVRMALVPRVLEARGLDVTPGMIERLEGAGDRASADVLRVILDEEVAHVAIGSRWFERACRERRVDPEATFAELLERFMPGAVRGPFNHDARRRAGFSADELRRLEGSGGD